MMTEAPDTTPGDEREIVITRAFDAPRALVFKAWTDPQHLARWWGPKDFTNPVCELDPRPGGAIRIDMTGPDGVVYPNTGVVHEIDEPERLVFTLRAFEDAAGHAGLEVLNTVTFEEHADTTQLTLRATIVRAAPDVDEALTEMEAGWNQSLDRLAKSLFGES